MGNLFQTLMNWIQNRGDDEKTLKDAASMPGSDHVITQPCHVLTARNEMVYLNQWLVDKDQQVHFVLQTIPEHSRMFQDHQRMFQEHERMVQDHQRMFQEHSRMFHDHQRMVQSQVEEIKKRLNELENRESCDDLDMVIVSRE